MMHAVRSSGRPGATVVALAATLVVAGCGGGDEAEADATGYWEGRGTARDTPLDDEVRNLTRESEAEFWFVVDEEGRAVGEAEVVYDAELRVDNLPSVNVGVVGFSPEVGGKVTDLDPRRRFPIAGWYDPGAGELHLAMVGGDELEPIQFTLRADPNVSAGIGGPLGTSFGVGGGGDSIVKEIPMTPWSPFGDAPGEVRRRGGGPLEARFEAEGENWLLQWSAVHRGAGRSAPETTPEIQDALRTLRERLDSP